LNSDNPQFSRLQKQAKKLGVTRIVSFGADKKADACLLDVSLHPTCSAVHASILKQDITYKLGVPGRHMVMNSLAALAAVSLAGADLVTAALSLSEMQPAAGRGERLTLQLSQGPVTLIDESYNANPASMAAALNVLGQASVAPRGRRIAVLGDMLELGTSSPDLHRSLVEAVIANRIDLVFCCGPLMRNLWDALPSARRGSYADHSAALESNLATALRAGDAVMIKGSLGSKMKIIVTALLKRFPGNAAFDDVAV
jgi:UDP-N-acetylmuramoyl-tripeptide--D-alanyl-D-alanine ligase